MRVKTIQWKPTPWLFARSCKTMALLQLVYSGADTSKCNVSHDWWEVEWPAPSPKEDAHV